MSSRAGRFLRNVIWNWAGVLLNITVGLVLSPILIRSLGADAFGLWTIILSLVDYYWLIDFGFRNATLKYTAHFAALGQPASVNRVLNTSMVYSLAAGLLMLAFSLTGGPWVAGFFDTDPVLFAQLFLIVGLTWSFGLVMNVFQAGLEGLQRYDLIGKITVVSVALRTVGMMAVLINGQGLLHLSWVLMGSQLFFYCALAIAFFRAWPAMRLSAGNIDRDMFKLLFSFARHAFINALAMRILLQGPPLLIAKLLPVRFLGYYSMPQKTLEYAADGISRVGMVAGSTAAELAARGDWNALGVLGVNANRYSLSLYILLTAFLAVYAEPLLRVWINVEFAQQSTTVLWLLLPGITAMNSQFSSSCILMALEGWQKSYVRGLMVEAVLLVGGLWIVVPHHGIAGAAACVSGLMFLDRGLHSAWLLSRATKIPFGSFLGQVYTGPLAVAAVTVATYWLMRQNWLPGENWPQLIGAGVAGAFVHGCLVYAFILRPEHRRSLLRLLPC